MIQGQNTPIRVRLGGDIIFENITTLSALLYKGEDELKHWNADEVRFEGNVMYLPLSETETMAFPTSIATLEVKALDQNENTIFWRKKAVQIEARKDERLISNGHVGNESKDEPIAMNLETEIIKGLNGKDGKDGLNGRDGRDGKDGINGRDGVDGKDGKDAEPYDDTEIRKEIEDTKTELNDSLNQFSNKKVGYSEVVGNQLLMYADETKEILLATLDLPSGGGNVDDVKINNTSIVVDGIASFIANDSFGIDYNASNKRLLIQKAFNGDIDNRVSSYRTIVPNNLPYAVKSVVTSKAPTEQLTDEEKVDAQKWLGILTLTQEEYDLIDTPSESTIYVIVG